VGVATGLDDGVGAGVGVGVAIPGVITVPSGSVVEVAVSEDPLPFPAHALRTIIELSIIPLSVVVVVFIGILPFISRELLI
jgi:hypothetical protein